jgi:hypothetical protein
MVNINKEVSQLKKENLIKELALSKSNSKKKSASSIQVMYNDEDALEYSSENEV